MGFFGKSASAGCCLRKNAIFLEILPRCTKTAIFRQKVYILSLTRRIFLEKETDAPHKIRGLHTNNENSSPERPSDLKNPPSNSRRKPSCGSKMPGLSPPTRNHERSRRQPHDLRKHKTSPKGLGVLSRCSPKSNRQRSL